MRTAPDSEKSDPALQRVLDENKRLRAELRAPRRDPEVEKMWEENKELRAQLRGLQRELTPLRAEHDLLEKIEAAVANAKPPDWVIRPPDKTKGVHGVPSVFPTDWHTGETVRSALVYRKNRYDRQVQEARVRQFIEGTLDLLFKHTPNPSYPGLVMPLGGDMVSGGIHEELVITNWADPVDSVEFCTAYLIKVIDAFLDAFPYLYVPCVPGNHGRLTKLTQHKRRAGTSLDTMIYKGLQRYYRNNRRVRIDVAPGVSVRYRIYDHTYLLLHGDPHSTGAKGGDGFIGSIGPIVRGTKKILGRNAQIDLEADTVLMGHWHTNLARPDVIVSDSMKGFDELAVGEGYDYAEPSHMLWLTHPERGPTIFARVFLDPKQKVRRSEPWVSFEDANGGKATLDARAAV